MAPWRGREPLQGANRRAGRRLEVDDGLRREYVEVRNVSSGSEASKTSTILKRTYLVA